jgi:DNA polymerase III subunit gamma/tau
VSYDSLISRISQLEKEVEELKKKGLSLSAEAVEKLNAGREAAAVGGSQEKAAPVKPKLPKAIPEDIRQVVANWKSIVRNMKEPAKTYLSGARLSIGGDDILLVVFEDDMAYGYIKNRPEHLEELEGYIEDAIEKRVEIRLEETEAKKFDDSYVDLSQIIHADIIVEDDEEE